MSIPCKFTDGGGNTLTVSVRPATGDLAGFVILETRDEANNVNGVILHLEELSRVMMVLRGMEEKYVYEWKNASFIFSRLYNGSGSVYLIEINQYAYSASYSQAFILMLGLEKCLPALMFGI